MNTYKETVKFLVENEQLDFDTIQDIEIASDRQTRDEYECEEPIHIYESYYIGDADEDVLNELAEKHDYVDYQELLNGMYSRFEDICEEKFEELINSKNIVFEVERDGEWYIYTTNEETAVQKYEDFETVLKESYTSFPGLLSFTQEEREYYASDFRDITFATDGLEDFGVNAEFGQKATIDGITYYKVRCQKTGEAYSVYYEDGKLKSL